MSAGHGKHDDEGSMTDVLFWIGLPLAFGLGLWSSYLLLRHSDLAGSNPGGETRQKIAQLRRARTRAEKRLREATEKVSRLRSELSDARETIEELKADRKKYAETRNALKARLRKMRTELEELQKASQERQARLAKTSTTSRETPDTSESANPDREEEEQGGAEDVAGLDILVADAEVTNRNQTYWQYSWRLKLANRGDRSLRLMGQILFQDKGGERIGGSPVDCRLESGETRTITGDCLIRSSAAENVEKLSVTISEIPGE